VPGLFCGFIQRATRPGSDMNRYGGDKQPEMTTVLNRHLWLLPESYNGRKILHREIGGRKLLTRKDVTMRDIKGLAQLCSRYRISVAHSTHLHLHLAFILAFILTFVANYSSRCAECVGEPILPSFAFWKLICRNRVSVRNLYQYVCLHCALRAS
jgi:hypothetical protein